MANRTPEQWRDYLVAELSERINEREKYQRYYDGEHPMPEVPEKMRKRATEMFARLTKMARTNWTALIVDATVERINVAGFRFSDTAQEESDEDAWAIWQASRLDAYAKLATLEAATIGSSFMLCWPTEEDPGVIITVESGLQCIVEYEEESIFRRAAGLKMWEDDGATYVTLYLPDAVYKWISRAQAADGVKAIAGVKFADAKWERRQVDGEDWPVVTEFGRVPLVEIRPRPEMDGCSRSELDGGVLDINDRINQTIFNRLVAGEFAAFKQRWATGLEIPLDPATNEPIEPFDAAADRLWVSESEDTKFGEFSATDLANYINSVEADVTHLAAITKTPPHYLLGALVNSSGDALVASETGLVAKVRDRMSFLGEDLEEVIRTAFAVKVTPDEQRAKDMACEVLWVDPEKRSEAEIADAAVKLAAIGVPREVLWRRIGATPQQVVQWKDMAAQDAIMAAIAQAPPQEQPQPTPPTPRPAGPPRPTPTATPTGGANGR